MDQQVKEFVTNPDELSSIPKTHKGRKKIEVMLGPVLQTLVSLSYSRD